MLIHSKLFGTAASLACSALLLVGGRPTAQAGLGAALTFHASFDNGPDADFGLGDKHLYTATSYRALETGQPGLHNPDVIVAPAKGKFGAALQFNAKNTTAIYYQADKNVAYRSRDWSGTVSFWLSLDPEQDLTGFADPIQVTDKDYNNAALWVDFTNDKPRHNRLGVFGDLAAWNPDKQTGQTTPAFLRHVAAVTPTPYARGTWTHVAFTFSGLNGPQPGSAKFYLDGKLQGTIPSIPEPLTMDPSKATVRIGVNYAGLYDDLAIFNRALSDGEIQTLFGLTGGVATLHR
jgi:hypothetical protein